MPWLRLDDGFGDHPKVAGLSDRAFRAHVEGLVYCARYLTDGQVPKAKAPSARVTGELEHAGLWSSTKRGFVIHDYLDFNPSKAEVLAEREVRSAQRSLAGKARAAGAHRVAGRFAPSDDQQTISGAAGAPVEPRTSPVPSPTQPQDQEQKTLARSEIERAFDAFWIRFPRKVGKRTARTAFDRALRRADVDDIIAGAESYRDDPNREDAYTAHPTTWLNRDGWTDDALPRRSSTSTHPLDRMARDLIEEVNANGDRASTSPGAAPAGELPGVAGQ